MTVSTTPASPRALLVRALASSRRDLIASSVLYTTHQLGESMVPVIIGGTIGQAVDHGDGRSIALWLALLALDFGLLSMSFRFAARASMRARQHTAHTVRMWLTERILHPGGGVRQPPGELLSRASSDATRVGAFARTVASTIAAVVVLIVSIALLLRFSVLLGAVIVGGTVLLLVVQDRIARGLRRRSTVEQHQQARATALAEDLIRGLRVLRGIGAERTAADTYAVVSQDAVGASLRAVSSEATLSAAATVLTGVYLTVIAGIGGWLALGGHLGLGQLVAALGLAQFVVRPMQIVAEASATYARALASAGRILDVVAACAAVADATSTPPNGADTAASGGPSSGATAAAVEFDGVLLDDGLRLDVRVAADAMTGFVCSDPIRAAILPELLAREHDPGAGRIRWAGVDIVDLPLDDLRERMLVSPHDAALFPGSIGDNVGALTDDRDAVAEASWAAFADQVLDTVPDGVDTLVGDRGEMLSGGQRQRVALARALAARPSVLVLHDPTTAVDPATENRIAERVHQVRAGRTTVVITTNPAWLSRCAQVVFLDTGQARSGSHAGLLAADPAYRTAVAR